ncbi:MAG: hypothetical protein IKG93_02070 [Clostridiales bacterium]|nr:hypothetical protein [Clostridiales bacterium]
MKRSIAAILTLSVILGLTGCRMTQETRTKKTTAENETTTAQPTKESETTESESETTESESETTAPETTETSETKETTKESETSDTSETSETSASQSESETTETSKESETSETSETKGSESSSETSETTTAPVETKKFQVSRDLEKPQLHRENSSLAVADLCKNYDNRLAYVSQYMQIYTFVSPGYDKMRNLLDSIYEGRTTMLEYQYKERVKTFYDDVPKISDSDAYYDKAKFEVYSVFSPARTDNQIFSFTITDRIPSDDENAPYTMDTFLNYDAMSGESIKLSDVITDRKAFASAIRSKYTKQLKGTWEDTYIKEENTAVEEISASIEKGEDIPFLLYYNAIVFQSYIHYEDRTDKINLVVATPDLEKCVNMDYFGQTTPYFSLPSDSCGEILWDFDEDEKVDKLSLSYTDKTIDFMLNNTKTSIDITSEMYADDGYELNLVMKTDSGYYAYVTCINEDPVNGNLAFRLNGEMWEFVGACNDFESFPFDPSNCFIEPRSDMMGTGHISVPVSFVGTNGLPKVIDSFYEKRAIAVTVQEMKLVKYNENGPYSDDFETIKLAAGTPVQLIGIDAKNEQAILCTLNYDPNENELFYMACYRDVTNKWNDYDYDIHFNGESSYSLFTGAMYAD